MIEKVNPSHPDKVADRIAGAIVDLAYKKTENPKIAVEVLIGHGKCLIIAETSVELDKKDICDIVWRIAGVSEIDVAYHEVQQDEHLAENQSKEIRCGDNGIFKGVPTNNEENKLSAMIGRIWPDYPTDGKFIYDEKSETFIACQSNLDEKGYELIYKLGRNVLDATVSINPLGDWTGGINVDTGATNRKLGSDMGRAVTGGGLHGKDLSKADVSVNIACFLKAKRAKKAVEALCAIGDTAIRFEYEDGTQESMDYKDVVEMAREHIKNLGGFEKLAEWGLW